MAQPDPAGKKSLWRDCIEDLKAWCKRKDKMSSGPFIFVLPMFFCCFAMWFQLVMEHYATYKYMHRYAMADAEVDHRFTTMFDPVQEGFEYEEISLKIVDAAGYVPAFVFLGVTISFLWCEYLAGKDETHKHPQEKFGVVLTTWTKVLSMWSVLAILKGILDAVTLQPDSADYAVCKERIHDWGVWWMRQEHKFWEFMVLDFAFYFWTGHKYTPPMRLCCDMMYSGHTFTVVIFALGSYELARISRLITPPKAFKCFQKEQLPFDASESVVVDSQRKFESEAKGWKSLVNISAISVIIGFSFVEQIYEIYVVEKSHFHYTVDIVVAIAMSFLVWTNSVIPFWAKKWGTKGLSAFAGPKAEWNYEASAGQEEGARSGGASSWFSNWGAGSKTTPLLQPHQVGAQHRETKPEDYLDSAGDILFPICVAPICCMCWPGPEEEGPSQPPVQGIEANTVDAKSRCHFTLRQHLYKDHQLRALIRHSCPSNDVQAVDKMLDSCERQMNMDEPISGRDFKHFVHMKEGFQIHYMDDDPYQRLYMRCHLRRWTCEEVKVHDKFQKEVTVLPGADLENGKDGKLIVDGDESLKDGKHVLNSQKGDEKYYPLSVTKEVPCSSLNPNIPDMFRRAKATRFGDLSKALGALWEGLQALRMTIWYQIVLPVLVLYILWKVCHVCWAFATFNYVRHYGMEVLGPDYFDNPKHETDPTVLSDPFRHVFVDKLGYGPADIPISRGYDIYSRGSFWQMLLVHLPEWGLFSMFLVLFCFKRTRHNALQVLQKVLFSLLLLLPFTASLCLLTSIPDASGWQGCQDKLEAMKCGSWLKLCPDGNFFSFFTKQQTSWNIVKFGVVNGRHEYGGGSCGISFSDYLGATVVESLGLFEMSLYLFRHRRWHRVLLVSFVTMYGFAMVGGMIILYEVEHIHYTMDWIVSISLGFLFYTNGGVAMFAKKYSKCGKNEDRQRSKALGKESPVQEDDQSLEDFKHIISSGDILIPPCCVPFCCLWGRYHIFEDGEVDTIVRKIHGEKKKEMERKLLYPNLDIYRGKFNHLDKNWEEITAKLRVKMALEEGIRREDFKNAEGLITKMMQKSNNKPKGAWDSQTFRKANRDEEDFEPTRSRST